MRKKIIFAVIIFSVLAVFTAAKINNSPQVIIKNIKTIRNSQSKDEELKFNVRAFGILPIGKASLNTTDGIRIKLIKASITPSVFLKSFFNASAEAESFIDKEKLVPNKFTQKISLPDKKPDIKTVLYDQKNNLMDLKGDKRVVLPQTQDPLSAVYFLRRQELEKGKEFDLNVNTNQKNYQFLAKVIDLKEYKISGKIVKIWSISCNIKRRDKNPYHKSSMKILLIDNSDKTPIYIEGFAGGFFISAKLTEN